MPNANISATNVIAFCASIVPSEKPVYVVCEPEHGQPFNECFQIVEKRCTELGGESIVGWAIWERTGIFIEAELHAVWRAPNGRIIDISPRPCNLARTTFLPDRDRKFTGRPIENIRHPLIADRHVKRYLYLQSRIWNLMHKHGLTNEQGQVVLTGQHAWEYSRAMKEAIVLESKLNRLSLAR